MRAFYLAYRPNDEILAQAVRELAESVPPQPVAETPFGLDLVARREAGFPLVL